MITINRYSVINYESANFEFIGHDKEGKQIKEMKLFLQQGENEQGKINYYLMLPSEY